VTGKYHSMQIQDHHVLEVPSPCCVLSDKTVIYIRPKEGIKAEEATWLALLPSISNCAPRQVRAYIQVHGLADHVDILEPESDPKGGL